MPLYNWDYVRATAEQLLIAEYGWTNPGAHYLDDLYQALMTYVLRVKFNIDRRKCNYSALVRSGQMTRDQALELIGQPYTRDEAELRQKPHRRPHGRGPPDDAAELSPLTDADLRIPCRS